MLACAKKLAGNTGKVPNPNARFYLLVLFSSMLNCFGAAVEIFCTVNRCASAVSEV